MSITTYLEVYTNASLTTWTDDYKERKPTNKLVDGCAVKLGGCGWCVGRHRRRGVPVLYTQARG
ncbi:hypothetical protein C2E23DRAFT_802710 [Lenzites betulinus]|nr:hypothetical protein C2E23DRAFT_802710 [Lenzites betulinus]